MSSVSEKTVIRARAIPATLRVSDWPFRDDPVSSGFLILSVLALSIAGAFAVRHFGMGFVIFLLMIITLRRIWVPLEYELGSKGVVHSWLGRRRRIPWTEFARFEIHHRGILLCGDAEPSPLSAWRGLFLRWTDNRDELLAVVEFYLQAPLQTALLSTRTLSQAIPLPPPPAPAAEKS